MKRTLSLSLVALFATGALAACDKEAGRKQETIGKVESGVGEIVGDKDLKKEGQKDQVAGNLKQGEIKDAIKDAKK
ncbi:MULTISPECIES: CsbD family protein [unclassified Caulobacter]|uniref:CsbD family protein n=1 Tax=unclassified Caulobacter TaxID=2648921 RepID=UPI0007837AB5|nr:MULTISPECIES: CsbD family protein [unclassified Caulobacter]